jgi:hypothetical protein
MRDLLLTCALAVAFVAGGVAVEMLVQAKILSAYFLPKGKGYVEPTLRIHPSLRHIILLALSAYAAIAKRGHRFPLQMGYLFLAGVVLWLTLFLWSVGREAARQRMATADK